MQVCVQTQIFGSGALVLLRECVRGRQGMSSKLAFVAPSTLRAVKRVHTPRVCVRRQRINMVKTASLPLSYGTKAPDFALEEPLTGTVHTLEQVRKENGLLVVFMCNHCPFVMHIANGLKQMGQHLNSLNVGMVGISSNDVQTFPQDSPLQMKNMARTHFDSFLYLYDETQMVARAYKAVCTPDIFLFDSTLSLVYQ